MTVKYTCPTPGGKNNDGGVRKAGWTRVNLILLCAVCLSLSLSSAQDAVTSAHGPASEVIAPSNSKDNGLSFPGALTIEVFGNFIGGTSRTAIWESLLRVGLAIDGEKALGLKGWTSQINALYPQGSGLTDAAVHDFNVLSNIDAYDSVRLYEAWVQRDFDDGRFSIRLGQILADAEFFDSDYGSLFINSSFGAIPLVSQNLNPPIFPVAAPGIRLRSDPVDSFYLEAALFSGDVGEPNTNDKHGLRFSLPGEDGVLLFAEIGFKINPNDQRSSTASATGEVPLSGTCKLGGYYDSKKFPDARGMTSHNGDYSFYLIIDQEIWHPDQNADRALSLFARLGGAPRDRNTVTLYGDGGINYKGIFPSRPNDTLGLGFSYTALSHSLVDDQGRRLASHHEGVLEVTYQAALAARVSLQPDLQIIFNPGAVSPAPTAVVAGLRFNLEF